MKALSPEQLLIIADAFCDKHNVQVTSFSALVAAAAVPGARFEGIAVFTEVTEAARALEEAICRLEPLDHANEDFAAYVRAVYKKWALHPLTD
ncbi:hypothetical protein [Corynebacterium pilosum]|uniref:TetR family regulatory protein n=1 Tax=Corynebacterium pilosum TaxID=35756 RepID=A0A376CLM0_9CORY|nr:hypothetical protein [Corynebacterium pilosum]STC69223.1 TetR family regulatory protein [Corynebacterium pilosum]